MLHSLLLAVKYLLTYSTGKLVSSALHVKYLLTYSTRKLVSSALHEMGIKVIGYSMTKSTCSTLGAGCEMTAKVELVILLTTWTESHRSTISKTTSSVLTPELSPLAAASSAQYSIAFAMG